MRRSLAALLLAPLLLVPLPLAGCAEPGANPSGDGPAESYGPDDLVLRVEFVGGFVPVEYLVTRLPTVSVYGDGRVITEGPVDARHPGPALPNVLVQRISGAGADRLVRLAVAAGVGRDDDLGIPQVTDMPSTRISMLTNHGRRQTTVYALGFAEESLSAAQQEGRQRLRALVDQLADLPATVGAAEVGEQQPYEPVAVAAVARALADSQSPAEQPEVAWPGPALPGEPLLGEVGCVEVTGTDLVAVLEAAGPANVLTPWVWEGQRYLVGFRPLLPDESSCPDLLPSPEIGPGDEPTPAYGADEVVLRVEYVLGFVMPQAQLIQLPIVTVYGDGRVVTADLDGEGALPVPRVRRISPTGLDRLVGLALEAGVGRFDVIGSPGAADAPGTQFTVLADDGPRRTIADGLSLDRDSLPLDEKKTLQRLFDLLGQLLDLPATLGIDAGEESPYEPRALAAASVRFDDSAGEWTPRPWPGPALPAAVLGNGVSCVDVTGAQVAPVLVAARTADRYTAWIWNGQRYLVWLRPLLPEESSCADLG